MATTIALASEGTVSSYCEGGNRDDQNYMRLCYFGCHMSETAGYALSNMQDHSFTYPGPNVLLIEDLDQLADGTSAAILSDGDCDLAWEVSMMALIKWWQELQEQFASAWNPGVKSPAPGLAEAERRFRIVREALAASITQDSPNEEVLAAFLRQYRLWTRSVCQMGHQGWPGVDWSDLDQLV